MPEQTPTQTTGGTRFHLSGKSATALVLVAIGVTFIVQNRQIVQVTLFITSTNGPLWAVLTSMLILGMVAGFLLRRRRR